MVRDQAPQLDITTEGFEPGEGVEDTVLLEGDQCQWVDPDGERCVLLLPEGHHPTRRYCEGHIKDGYLRKASAKKRKDVPPVNVNIKIPTAKQTKLDPTEQKVKEAATAWLGLAAALLEASGDPVCSEAIRQASGEIALQLAALSKFHPIIVKVLAPVEASGEALVWISLAVAVAPVVLAILAHHNLISKEMGERLGLLAMMGAVVGSTPPGAQDADGSQAA